MTKLRYFSDDTYPDHSDPRTKGGRRPGSKASKKRETRFSKQRSDRINGRCPHGRSFLADCVDRGILDLAEQEFPQRDEPFLTRVFIFSLADHYEHPLNRRDAERSVALHSEWRAWLRDRIVRILGCEKTVHVLLAIFDNQITRAEVARCLNVPRYKVTREIERLKGIIADRW